MKQIRKISNIVAEELQSELASCGITLDESAFEERVSQLVDTIAAGISESAKCADCEEIDEDIFVDDVYVVLSGNTIAGKAIEEGDYVEVCELDLDTDKAIITIYNADGDVKEEEVEVPYAELDNFLESDSVEAVEQDEIEEGIHIKGGVKVKVSAAVEKLRAKLKSLKGDGVNKFTIKAGKIVRKTADQLKASKEKSKTFARKMARFAGKRAKSLKKSNAVNSGANSGSVAEGFDLVSGGVTFALECGDTLSIANGALSVVREGKTIVNGVAVDESFIDKCIEEGVVAIEEDVEEPIEEGAVLTYKSSKGYVLIKEGSEIAMGNRVRARAYLTNEGFTVSADMLDKASNGDVVVL